MYIQPHASAPSSPPSEYNYNTSVCPRSIFPTHTSIYCVFVYAAFFSASTFFAFLPTFSVPGGTFNPPNTSAHTATMPAAPVAYAVSRPAHQ